MAGSAQAPWVCPECGRLLQDFKADNDVLIEIHKEQAEAAIKNDLEAFDALKPHLSRARRRRNVAAEALKRHVRQHTAARP